MSYLIVGASSGLGRELAYVFAGKGNSIIISSRDAKDLDAIKSDITNKFKNVSVQTLPADLNSPEDFINNLKIKGKGFSDIEGAIFPVGGMFDEDGIYLENDKVEKILKTNFSSITLIISELSKAFNDNGKGLVIGFGSVSGLLGRKFNSHYAASKRALESYFESLAASQINDKIKIQFYILGYLETNLSFGKNLKLPKGSPKKLAELVYKKKNINFKKIYFPFWWGLIAFLLKIIPINFLIKLIKNSKS